MDIAIFGENKNGTISSTSLNNGKLSQYNENNCKIEEKEEEEEEEEDKEKEDEEEEGEADVEFREKQQQDQSDEDSIELPQNLEIYQDENNDSILLKKPSSIDGKSFKSNAMIDKPISNINFDERCNKTDQLNSEITELLGSVTTHKCPGTRASARVIQKMKQDQTRPSTPPPLTDRESKNNDKSTQKTPSHVRTNKPTWTNVERNHFFDALNEFGKDFDAIGNYINLKLKRKSATDVSFKTKDQVRQHYYQTFHKICKYIKFSDEIKKPAQELYALINYGEMRRKLQFVTDKHFIKLKNLVYQGYTTVRCKGKNIRIKTPSCKTLRRLNQLDDSLEDIRLPSKIEVIISPANMESFGRVQMIAQNPRVRITVPLHKKLTNFITAFQYKWRNNDIRLAEDESKLLLSQFHNELNNGHSVPSETQEKATINNYQYSEMCFLPKPGVTIHRPLLSITEYLSSVNICLTAYEERMGIKIRGENVCQDRLVTKRQRTDSGSEKRSPETKKQKIEIGNSNDALLIKEDSIPAQESDIAPQKSESSGDELSDEINELLTETEHLRKDEMTMVDVSKLENHTFNSSSSSSSSVVALVAHSTSVQQNQMRIKRSSNSKVIRSALTFKPLLNDDVIQRIRKGWTVSNAADITIGDLYVVLGQDSKLELDYYWTDTPATDETFNEATSTALVPTNGMFTQKQNDTPSNSYECNDTNLLKTLGTSTLGNKLKHLLLIANLSERIRKRQCSCGHSCDRNATKTRIERNLAAKTFISPKTFTPNIPNENNTIFRQPVAPMRRPAFSMDPVKQLSALSRPKMSRQVLVQRLLLPGGSYDLLDVKNLENNYTQNENINKEERKSNVSSSIEDNLQINSETVPITNSDSAAINDTAIDICNIKLEKDYSVVNTFALPSATMEAKSNKILISKPNLTSNSDILTKAITSSSSSSSSSSSLSSTNILKTTQTLTSNLPNIQITPISATTAVAKSTTNETSDMQTETSLHSLSSVPDSAFDECSSTSSLYSGMSPMQLLRESTSNSRWLEDNINDFSLTSLLGHLDEISGGRDILDPSSNLSVISESSVDYRHKFLEITALMQNQDKE